MGSLLKMGGVCIQTNSEECRLSRKTVADFLPAEVIAEVGQ